ncbi:hypothetical protein C427_0230 [Paraglaciecola psychrophila 170]|uniref:Uncharacterized protein n=1 Tax=Paraglaciecola psychrophila 170 TaxID=1129794 RepID=M4RFL8_9ALTE|nr:hypothetical protein C427_0230 [Paraglaciecola psychrophila 170]
MQSLSDNQDGYLVSWVTSSSGRIAIQPEVEHHTKIKLKKTLWLAAKWRAY